MGTIAVSGLLDYAKELLVNVAREEAVGRPDRLKVRPMRSVLFVPGHRRDWIRKAERFGADGIVLDLEDAVQPADRGAARTIVKEELAELSRKVSSVWVRVNAAPEEMALDLEAAARPGTSVIMLPKAHGPESILAAERLVGYYEGRNGLELGSLVICPILETAGGVRTSYEIAMSSPRIEYMGAVVAPQGDTALALRMDVMSDAIGTESLYLRSKIVVDVRAAGMRYPIGGTVTDLSPEHRVLRPFAQMNKKIGHSGMMVIHPSHVSVVNEIYSSTPAEIEHALKVLAIIRDSRQGGAIRGPVAGQMIDFAHARFSAQLLEEAESQGVHLPAGIDV